MPQRAILDGDQSVLAIETNRDAWEGLTAAYAAGRLALPCCGAKAIPKENVHGTRYFSHPPYKRIECKWKAVSAKHETAVAAVAEQARALEWIVSTEESGVNWRADILCSRAKSLVRMAIMVELQSREDAADDERGFEAEGIASLWMVSPRVDVRLPDDTRIVTLPPPDYPAEAARCARIFLQKVAHQFTSANGVLEAIKGTEWTAKVAYWRGIPRKIDATKATTGETVPIDLDGHRVDLSFVRAKDGPEHEPEMILQKELAGLFQNRLAKGIEVWWPEYPVLAHDTFLALKRRIAEERSFVDLVPPEPEELRPSANRTPRVKRGYSLPRPSSEKAPIIDKTAWGELRAKEVQRAAEKKMTREEAVKWMDTPNKQLAGRSPRELAFARSDVLQTCEIILGLRDAKTLKPLL